MAAWQEASVGAESNGLRLTAVNVNVGDVVKAGQVLATFAADTVQADVAQARASVMEAEANAAEAAANAERARGLQASGALSQQQIQQYTTAEQTAKARVEAARAQLNAQQLRLKFTQVLAPDSGVISARTATVGAVVGSGTELFRMVRKGRLEWRAEVTQAELARIRPGPRCRSPPPAARRWKAPCAWWAHRGHANAQRPGLCGICPPTPTSAPECLRAATLRWARARR